LAKKFSGKITGEPEKGPKKSKIRRSYPMSCDTTPFVDAFEKHCAGKQSCDYQLHKFEPRLDFVVDGKKGLWAKCCKKSKTYIQITYGCAQIPPVPAIVDENGICASCSSTG